MRDFHRPGRSAVLATNGMCATSHPLAAGAAVDILKQGGNAVDAAIAGAVILGLAEPQMTGIGGDCFALISPAGGDEVIAVNGSGRAPAAADAAALRAEGHETVPLQSAHAVTVPGAIDAFCTMSDRWGRLGLADSLAPAIRYMEDGVPVSPRVAFDWEDSEDVLSDSGRRHFMHPDGSRPKVGAWPSSSGAASRRPSMRGEARPPGSPGPGRAGARPRARMPRPSARPGSRGGPRGISSNG